MKDPPMSDYVVILYDAENRVLIADSLVAPVDGDAAIRKAMAFMVQQPTATSFEVRRGPDIIWRQIGRTPSPQDDLR